jgi:putative membrane protein
MIRRSILAGRAGTAAIAPPIRHATAQQTIRGGDLELRQRIVAASTFSVATSRLAAAQGSAATVKAFAGFEIAEQTSVARAMELAALPVGQVPTDAEHAQQLRQLEALNGSEFDRMYLQGQLAGHRELLALHQRSATSGARDDRIISTIAIAGIEQHIAMLQGMQTNRG